MRERPSPDHWVDEVDPETPDRDHELRMDLERAFEQLDRTDRELLMLVDFLGFGPREAAGIMQVEPNTFRMRLHRARARMRARMEVLRP
jgi:RNA polymerase sigma factor (sigma-70 family)